MTTQHELTLRKQELSEQEEVVDNMERVHSDSEADT